MENNTPNISQDQEELFDRYLFQEMDAVAKEALERNLVTDSALRDALAVYKASVLAIEESALKEKIEAFHDELSVNDPKVVHLKKPRKINYWIAASIAVLLCLGGLWFFKGQQQNQNLFDTYFEPDPGLPTVMGKTDDYDFYEAMVDYKQANYSLAIEKWEKQLDQNMDSDTLNYFLGSAYLAQGNEVKAIDFLNKSVKIDDSPFKAEAYFYLGLGYLKTDNLQAAKTNLGRSGLDKALLLLSELEE